MTQMGTQSMAVALREDELKQISGGRELFTIGTKKFTITEVAKMFGASVIPGLPCAIRTLEGQIDGENPVVTVTEGGKELIEQAIEVGGATLGSGIAGTAGKAIGLAVSKGVGTVWKWFKDLI